MVLKVLTMVGGMAGAVFASQYPAFTQQYMQRMAGQVNALETIVEDFDASASASGMTRDEALAAMGGTKFLENRRHDMRASIERLDGLSADLAALRLSSPVERLMMPHRVADTDLAFSTWEDFEPALPFSMAGLMAACGGFLLGYGIVAALLHFLSLPFKQRQRKSGLQF